MKSLFFLIVLSISSSNLFASAKITINLTKHEQPIPFNYRNVNFYKENSKAPFVLDQTYKNEAYLINLKTDQKEKEIYEQYLYDFQTVQFIGQVAIGSNKQVMKVIFDSGSSILWFSNSKDPYASDKKSFECSTSSQTCVNDKTFVNPKIVIYGSGKIEGKKVIDSIWVPGIQQDNKSFQKLEKSEIVQNKYISSQDKGKNII